MQKIDETILIWANSWVGNFTLFDQLVELVVSDYLIPVGFSLTLLGIWFAGANPNIRLKYQLGVLESVCSMALASWIVFIINGIYFRPRPFSDHDLSLLFYQPTDSSFPANAPTAMFGIALAILLVNRRVGIVLVIISIIYGLSRVYAGVHYPTDIIAASIIGILSAFLVHGLRRVLEPIPTILIKMARVLCLA